MEFFVVSVLNGVVHGLLLFMVSAGLTLIFGMMGVLNFAHAWFYMLGAYVGFTCTRTIGFWLGLIAAPIIVGACGVLVERYMLRRVHKYGHAHELLLTFGLAFIIEEVIKLFYGDFPVNYADAGLHEVRRVHALRDRLPVLSAVHGWRRARHVRRALSAADPHPSRHRSCGPPPTGRRMVEALGHNLPVVFMGVFAVGAGLAGLAGAVAGAFFPTGPNMAVDFGTLVFVVVVVGGLGSLEGALLASLMIGLFISFSVGFNGSTRRPARPCRPRTDWAHEVGGLLTLQLSTIAASMPFLLMLLVLLIRPAGLLGDRQ